MKNIEQVSIKETILDRFKKRPSDLVMSKEWYMHLMKDYRKNICDMDTTRVQKENIN